MDGKIEQHVCIEFCVKLSKSTTETHEMLREAFGERTLSQTGIFEWHSHFKAGRVSVEDDEQSGRPSTSKTTENVEKSRTRPRRPSPSNPSACRYRWDQLWSLPGDLNRKFKHAPHCHRVCFSTLDK
jgi:hypothetical protein